ncbi:AAA family ATPase [Solidesulfovibrio magneticus]|uniref:Toprim domain-containing protein n=1 Tax=Solidesulfovibrio magneticus (strain ATCC 700980 / DSM 13731 / RS-1) TaxID=573370 RepID=C4XNJ0_SOLM1|nr:AAA family ATPase [Solidesulfovibrio magneticus]BAH74965.1 hypothetical protein DMR_14740 [Solidesulfovibrio magneticus RS-1]
MATELWSEFRAFLESAGLRPVDIIADGAIHRCGTAGKERGADGAYLLYPDSPAYGHCWNFRTGEEGVWRDKSSTPLSKEAQARIEKTRRARQQADDARHATACRTAQNILKTARPAPDDHPYLVRKGVRPHDKIYVTRDGRLAVPICDANGTPMSLQFITAKGEKRFLAGGKIRGGFFRIEGNDGPLYLVEGYAIGATIHAAAKGTVLVCFTCHNLRSVAETARQAFPGRPMVICADNDHETAARYGKNPGIDHAVAAALAVQARVAAPDFKEPAGKTDFNDLAASEGLDAVKVSLAKAEPPATPPVAGGQTTGAKAPIVVLSASDFLAYGFPKREHILDPILPSQGLALLYAPRGLGKTFLALTLAYGVAAGQAVLRWKTPRPRNVLFVDGEMPGWMLQERLSGIVKGYGGPVPEQLRIITPDCQPDFLANLATPEGQAALDPALAGVELLILDNLATLCRIGKENEAESWLPVQAWLLSLRRCGIAVVVVHHANKNGGQRGTSSREDVMDTVIALLPVKDHTPADGARFEVHLQKARGLAGSGADPFVARLVAKDGTFQWTTHPLSENVDKILSLADQGKSVREIAKLTDIPKSTVQRTLDKHLPTKSSTSPRPRIGGPDTKVLS